MSLVGLLGLRLAGVRGCQRHQAPFGHPLGVAAEGSCGSGGSWRAVEDGKLGLDQPLLIKGQPGARGPLGVIENGQLRTHYPVADLEIKFTD